MSRRLVAVAPVHHPGGAETARLAAAVVEVLSRRQEIGKAARLHARRFYSDGYVERVERFISS